MPGVFRRTWRGYYAPRPKFALSATQQVNREVTAQQGVIHLTGQNASVNLGRNVTAQQGLIHITGQDAGITRDRSVTAQQGLIHVTGQNATVETTGAVNAQQGVIYITGQNATVNASRVVNAQQGVIHLTGQNADVSTGKVITAQQGVIHLTGQNATVEVSRVVVSQQGVIHITGRKATVSVTTDKVGDGDGTSGGSYGRVYPGPNRYYPSRTTDNVIPLRKEEPVREFREVLKALRALTDSPTRVEDIQSILARFEPVEPSQPLTRVDLLESLIRTQHQTLEYLSGMESRLGQRIDQIQTDIDTRRAQVEAEIQALQHDDDSAKLLAELERMEGMEENNRRKLMGLLLALSAA